MKKYLFLVFLLLTSVVSLAEVPYYGMISFEVRYFDPTYPPKPRPKSPINVPTVILDDYELTFQSAHPAYTLFLYEDNVLIHSTEISPEITTVNLPSWLSGEYEIQLCIDDCSYYFCGFIDV